MTKKKQTKPQVAKEKEKHTPAPPKVAFIRRSIKKKALSEQARGKSPLQSPQLKLDSIHIVDINDDACVLMNEQAHDTQINSTFTK